MPEDTKKDSTPIINWELAEAKLKSIETKAQEYAGKQGFNPFLWLRAKGLTQVRGRLAKGVKLGEDYVLIMKTEFEVPTAPGCSPEDKPAKV